VQEDDAVTLSKIQKDELVKNGFCILPTVLNQERLIEARNALQGAIKKTMDRGLATHIPGLDPNEHNIRIFNLLDLDPLFVDLIADAEALSIVKDLIGNDFIVSNFTANIAKPGSGSMEIHSDLSLVHPPPWDQPWAINIIWVLNDMREENGATRYLPFSHKINQPGDLPKAISKEMCPIEAEAGSIIAMDGRLWHTSGANITQNEERGLLFGYYTRSFIRPQWNFTAGLSDETKSSLPDRLKYKLGLELASNTYADYSNHTEK